MHLRNALLLQGNTLADVEEIIEEMIADLNEGADPEELLSDYNLEPDYVMDLLALAR